MMGIISVNPNEHICLKTSEDIVQLTQPLFEFLPINYFRFLRIWKKDGSYIRLSTNSYWTQHYLEKDYGVIASPHSIFKPGESSFYLLDLLPEATRISPVLQDAKQYYELDHGFSMQETYDEFIDIYDMTAHPTQLTINELYLRYIDSIKKFMGYFKLKGHSLIKKVEEHKFDGSGVEKTAYSNMDEKKQKFDEALAIDRLIIPDNKGGILLTKRETQCIMGLLCGKSSKMLGKELGLSSRTIEFYIDCIKIKLRCSYKNEIIERVIPFINLHYLIGKT